jgi:hypothetical protein
MPYPSLLAHRVSWNARFFIPQVAAGDLDVAVTGQLPSRVFSGQSAETRSDSGQMQ